MRKQLKNNRWAVVLLVAILLVGSVGAVKLLSVGYLTGYQGLEMRFNSIYYKGYWYTDTNPGPNPNYQNYEASVCEIRIDRVNFDPDETKKHRANLRTSQQPVLVDTTVDPKTYGPWRIKVDEETKLVPKSNETHSWTEQVTTEVYKEYQIERYRCEWRVNLWLDGPQDEGKPGATQHYYDLQLWIKVIPQSFVYFVDNPDEVYFSPSYIGLDQDVTWRSGEHDPNDGEKDPDMAARCDLFPEAEGETCAIFYARGAEEVDLEGTILSYQGAQLDPAIFRDEYWIRIGVDRFLPRSVWELGGLDWSWKYPSALMVFKVYVFVVGEWTVKLEKGEVKDLKSHQAGYGSTTDIPGILGSILSGILYNPFTWIIIAIIVIALLSIFAPGVLFGLMTLLTRRRKR